MGLINKQIQEKGKREKELNNRFIGISELQ